VSTPYSTIVFFSLAVHFAAFHGALHALHYAGANPEFARDL
jgi:hypothetical protein